MWQGSSAVTPASMVGVQVCQHIQAIAKPCGVWAAVVVGGLSPLKQACVAAHKSCITQHHAASVMRGVVAGEPVMRMQQPNMTPDVLKRVACHAGAAAVQVARDSGGDAWSAVGPHAERRR